MAAEIRRTLGLESRLERGDPGEFTIWMDGEKIAAKGFFGFPRGEHVVELIRNKKRVLEEPEPTSRS